MEVQLNLDYRRYWDNRIINLNYILRNQSCSVESNGECTLIRWIANFPFPLANREYVYLRRWWAQPLLSIKEEEKEQVSTLSQDRNSKEFEVTALPGSFAFIFSRSLKSMNKIYTNGLGGNNNLTNGSWSSRLKQNNVLVDEYHSEMLIKSNGKFNEVSSLISL